MRTRSGRYRSADAFGGNPPVVGGSTLVPRLFALVSGTLTGTALGALAGLVARAVGSVRGGIRG